MLFSYVSVGFFFCWNFLFPFKNFSLSPKSFMWQNDSQAEFTTHGYDALHNGVGGTVARE